MKNENCEHVWLSEIEMLATHACKTCGIMGWECDICDGEGCVNCHGGVNPLDSRTSEDWLLGCSESAYGIECDISWHQENPDEDLSDEYQAGFVAGMKQAKFIVTRLSREARQKRVW